MSNWYLALPHFAVRGRQFIIVAISWDAQQKLRFNLCYNEISIISMCLNVAKSITLIFSPYKSNRRVYCRFLNSLCVVILF